MLVDALPRLNPPSDQPRKMLFELCELFAEAEAAVLESVVAEVLHEGVLKSR